MVIYMLQISIWLTHRCQPAPQPAARRGQVAAGKRKWQEVNPGSGGVELSHEDARAFFYSEPFRTKNDKGKAVHAVAMGEYRKFG